MKFNDLNVVKKQSTKRVGRGIAAGQGKTAGRGTKGQKSRAGSSRKPGFEGGQNPLMQRLPKLRGFTSKRDKVENVYTDQLKEVGAVVDNHTLHKAGLVSSPHVNVKLIVGKEAVSAKHDVKLQGASKTAIEQLGKKGGKFNLTGQVKRAKVAKKDQ